MGFSLPIFSLWWISRRFSYVDPIQYMPRWVRMLGMGFSIGARRTGSGFWGSCNRWSSRPTSLRPHQAMYYYYYFDVILLVCKFLERAFALVFRHWVIDPVISLWWLYTCTYMVGNMKLVFLIRLFFAIAIKLLNHRPSVRNDHHQLVVHSNAWGGQSLCQNATGTSICLFKWK